MIKLLQKIPTKTKQPSPWEVAPIPEQKSKREQIETQLRLWRWWGELSWMHIRGKRVYYANNWKGSYEYLTPDAGFSNIRASVWGSIDEIHKWMFGYEPPEFERDLNKICSARVHHEVGSRALKLEWRRYRLHLDTLSYNERYIGGGYKPGAGIKNDTILNS